ncbi:MAG: DnaD domain protein [Clostridiales bacterium]|nr:DnaD domain protein [Clostridiales bacterium]
MFVKLSPQSAINLKISVDNLFIEEYMPHAPDSFVKVYLFGLSLVSHNIDSDNSIERIAKRLQVEPSQVIKAYEYWADQGLVNILCTVPQSVEYLPVKESGFHYKRKFKVDKYKDFNRLLHSMLPTRQVLQQEFFEYYTAIETLHMSPEAMLSVISYCTRLKGQDIGYRYILAVARNLAREGILSFDAVNEHLNEIKLYETDILAIFKALKLKRSVDHEDKTMYVKWTKSFGFELQTILHVSKKIKSGGMEKLDTILQKYYQSSKIAKKDIEEYERQYDSMDTLAKEVLRILGLFYGDRSNVVDTYITKWLALGYDHSAVTVIAQMCFKRGLKSLDLLDENIEKFFKQGLLTVSHIDKHMQNSLAIDKKIKSILEITGLERIVTARDRDYYRTWTYSWKITDEIIEYAATIANGSNSPLPFMNVILADWFDKGIKTVQQAKELQKKWQKNDKNLTLHSKSSSTQIIKNKEPTKMVTAEMLNSLFEGLNE